jgi:predicted alpha/beta hydrolase family esterase
MKAYLIPGWGEDLKDRDYMSVLKLYKEAGYEPKLVTIDWNYKNIDDWVEEVKAKISRTELQNSLLSGFSFGAMISFIVAAEYANPKQLLLFSLSPYFAEDIPKLKKSWLGGIGKRKVERFKNLSMAQYAPNVECQTAIFVGVKEGEESVHRARDANQQIKNSQLVMLDRVGHDVSDPRYVDAIRQELNT